MESGIQLAILSSDSVLDPPLRLQSSHLPLSKLLPLLCLSTASCLIHLYYLCLFLQEFGVISSIIVYLSSVILINRPSTPKLSFGYLRVLPISTLFSYLFLLSLAFWNSYLQFSTIIESSPVTLHLIVMLIDLIQLLFMAKSKNLIQVFIFWSLFSHLLSCFYSDYTKFLTLGLDLTACVLATICIFPQLTEVMEKSPFDSEELENGIKCIEGVLDLHDFHMWQVGNKILVNFHVVATNKTILRPIRKICSMHGIQRPTVQVEFEGFNCKSHKLH